MAEVSQRRGLPPHFIVQQRDFANRASSATWDDDPDESQEHSHKHLGEAPSNHTAQSSYRDHEANDNKTSSQSATNGSHATTNGAPQSAPTPAPAPAGGGGGWGPMAVRKAVFEHHDPNDTGPTIPEHMLSARAKKSKKGKGRDPDPEPVQTLSTKPVEPKTGFYASKAQTTSESHPQTSYDSKAQTSQYEAKPQPSYDAKPQPTNELKPQKSHNTSGWDDDEPNGADPNDQDPKVEPEAWRRAIEAPGGRDEATVELLAEYGASVQPEPEEDYSHLPLLLRLEPLNPPEDPNRVVPVRLTAFERRELKAQLDEDIDDYWQNGPGAPLYAPSRAAERGGLADSSYEPDHHHPHQQQQDSSAQQDEPVVSAVSAPVAEEDDPWGAPPPTTTTAAPQLQAADFKAQGDDGWDAAPAPSTGPAQQEAAAAVNGADQAEVDPWDVDPSELPQKEPVVAPVATVAAAPVAPVAPTAREAESATVASTTAQAFDPWDDPPPQQAVPAPASAKPVAAAALRTSPLKPVASLPPKPAASFLPSTPAIAALPQDPVKTKVETAGPSLPPAPAIAHQVQEKKPEASIPTPAPTTTAAAVNAPTAAAAAPSAVSKSFSRLEAILEKARQTRSAMAYTMASH